MATLPLTLNTVDQLGLEVLSHPTYSLDLAPVTNLLGKIKNDGWAKTSI